MVNQLQVAHFLATRLHIPAYDPRICAALLMLRELNPRFYDLLCSRPQTFKNLTGRPERRQALIEEQAGAGGPIQNVLESVEFFENIPLKHYVYLVQSERLSDAPSWMRDPSQSWVEVPQSERLTNEFEVRGIQHAALAESGDFFEFLEADSDHLAVVLADVVGRGEAAAERGSVLRRIIHEEGRNTGFQLPAWLLGINARVSQVFLDASLFLGVFDRCHGDFTYVTSGFPAPIFIVEGQLVCPSAPELPSVGMLDGKGLIVPGRQLLQRGDLVLAFSDGVTSIQNGIEQGFSRERVVESVFLRRKGLLRDLIEGVISDALDFNVDEDLVDDATVIGMRVLRTHIYKVERVKGIPIIRCRGKITIGEGDIVLRETINYCLNVGDLRILLDLSNTTYLDSSGNGELVACYKRVREAGGKLKLMKVSGRVSDVFALTKLQHLYEIFEDEASALASVLAESTGADS
jgi:anti-anti-sigma factor